jgi:pimeloyl-ACP methyl ester carboxylesterase
VSFTPAAGVELFLDVHERNSGQNVPAGAPAIPVILLHGLSQQRYFWGPVLRRMAWGPVAVLDQRGHGQSNTALDVDYSVTACANDVIAAMDALGWPRAVVVGHSWGASVALRAAALRPDRIASAALIDGGLWSPRSMGPRDEVRVRLTPPRLGIPTDDLWSMIRSGPLGTHWSDELQDALTPTFMSDDQGRLSSRLGLERHMLVLDGLMDVEPDVDLDACHASGVPIWASVCEPAGASDGFRDLKSSAVASASGRDNLLVHRWAGAIHDVPLQWPNLVAGFIDTVVASAMPATSNPATSNPDERGGGA